MLTNIIKQNKINLAIIRFMVPCVTNLSGKNTLILFKKCFQKFFKYNFKISLGLNYFLRK